LAVQVERNELLAFLNKIITSTERAKNITSEACRQIEENKLICAHCRVLLVLQANWIVVF